MVVLLLKFVFFVISILSNIVTRLIFNIIAYLLFFFIQAFKVPGEAIQGALEQLAEAIRACVGFILEHVMEAISSLISSAFDHFVQAVIESGSAVGGLVEQARDSLDGLLKSLPDVLEGVSEFVSTIVSDLWKNYVDALENLTENA